MKEFYSLLPLHRHVWSLFEQSSSTLDGVSLWSSFLEGQSSSPRCYLISIQELFFSLKNWKGTRWCTTLTRWIVVSLSQLWGQLRSLKIDSWHFNVLTTFQNFLTRTKMLRQGNWKLVQRPSGTSDWIEEPHLASYTHSEHYQAGTSCFRNIKIHKISNCLLKTSKSSQAILVPLCRPGQRPLPQSQQMQHTCSTWYLTESSNWYLTKIWRSVLKIADICQPCSPV